MKSCSIILLLFSFILAGCYRDKQPQAIPKSDGKKSYKEFVAGVKIFPYEASLSRKDPIIRNYSKLEIGMSKDQIVALIGEPDYSQLSYGPKGPGEKWLGSTWNYFLYLNDSKSSQLNAKPDQWIEIFFDTEDKAHCIGPSKNLGLEKKGCVSNRTT